MKRGYILRKRLESFYYRSRGIQVLISGKRVGKTSSLLTKHEQRKPRITRLQRNWFLKTGRNYRKTRCLEKHKEKEHKHLHNSPACKSLTKTNFKIRWAKGRFSINTSYR